MLTNLTRQLQPRSYAMVGCWYDGDFFAEPWRGTSQTILPVLSTSPPATPLITPFGTLWVDPATAVPLRPRSTSATTGMAPLNLPVPDLLSFRGVPMSLQDDRPARDDAVHLAPDERDRGPRRAVRAGRWHGSCMPTASMATLALPAEEVCMRFRALAVRLPPEQPQAGPELIVEWLTQPQAAGPATASCVGRTPAVAVRLVSPAELFLPATGDPQDRARQQAMDQELGAFVDAMCTAIERSFRLWQSAARLVDVRIEGAIASGGRLDGPGLECLLRALPSVQRLSGWSRRLGEGIAGGFASTWGTFCRSVSVPDLAWYPEFAAVAASCAPPTPNVPAPFTALAQEPGLLHPAMLYAAMLRRTPGGTPHAEPVLAAVAVSLFAALERWRRAQMVANVFGSGRVPAYDPPRVAAGPVVAGEGRMTPGGLACEHP